MGAFLTTAAVFVAAIAGMVILYSQKEYTLPGYRGKGGYALPVIVGGLGVLGTWGLARLLGLGNVFTATSNAITFGLAYDSVLTTAGAVALLVALLAIATVATINLVRYGRAVM